MSLHLLALLERSPRRTLRGIDGPARFLPIARGVVAAVEARREAPPADERTLRAHDAAVRRLCDAADAVLPARFAAPLADEAELRRALAPRTKEIAAAFDRVRGREQMSLRVLRVRDPEQTSLRGLRVRDPEQTSLRGLRVRDPEQASLRGLRVRDPEQASLRGPRVRDPEQASLRGLRVRGREQTSRRGPHARSASATPSLPRGKDAGRRFLEARREALVIPALDPLRGALSPLVRDERVDPHDAPLPLLATVHHLVDRGNAEPYRFLVEKLLESGIAPPLAVRGPFPAYAFVTEEA